MSRTFKDIPSKIRFPEVYDNDRYETLTCETEKSYGGRSWIGTSIYLLEKKGYKRKQKRHEFREWNWLQSTPSWWTRLMMQKPKRRACRDWERKALYIEDLEDYDDCPDFGRKPHQYYW